MLTIRNNTFETNSSSCHVVTICNDNMLKKYLNGDVICMTELDLEEHYTCTCILNDGDFYDIDRFYLCLQEHRELILQDLLREKDHNSYTYYMATYLLDMNKEECENCFFKGGIDAFEKFDASELADYLSTILDKYVMGIHFNNYRGIFNSDAEQKFVTINGAQIAVVSAEIDC